MNGKIEEEIIEETIFDGKIAREIRQRLGFDTIVSLSIELTGRRYGLTERISSIERSNGLHKKELVRQGDVMKYLTLLAENGYDPYGILNE